MDTKSKKSRFSLWIKILAWVLCIGSVCGASVLIPLITTVNMTTTAPDYARSSECRFELESYANIVNDAYYTPSDSEIKAQVDDLVRTLKDRRDSEITAIESIGKDSTSTSSDRGLDSVLNQLDSLVDDALNDSIDSESTSPSYNTEDAVPENSADAVEEYKKTRLAEVNQSYSQKIASMENIVRNSNKKIQTDAKAKLDAMSGMLYVVYQLNDLSKPLGTNISITGVAPLDYLAEQEATLGTINTLGHNTSEQSSAQNFIPSEFMNMADNISYSGYFLTDDNATTNGLAIATALGKELYDSRNANYFSVYKIFGQYVAWLLACIVVFLISFIWLMYTSGRNPYNSDIKIGRADIVYLDIGFVLMVIAEILLFGIVAIILSDMIFVMDTLVFTSLSSFGYFSSVIGGVVIFLLWAVSLSRRRKNGTSKTFTITYMMFGSIKKAYDDGSFGAKGVAAFILYILLGIFVIWVTVIGVAVNFLVAIIGFFMLGLYILFSIQYIIKKGTGISKIEIGVDAIKNGDIEYVISPTGNTNLDRIASGVNNITQGLSTAVKKEVKADRMKTELITNISHDLKTPLTSILTYVDLLKKENDLSNEARHYVEVLDLKSHRLKTLTDDLFEAAKAQSGDMNVVLTRIELVQFMEQALGELSDRMLSSKLSFVTEFPTDNAVYVMADGKLLFRVVGNIIDNAIKYSMPNSRVYIGMTQGNGKISLTVKNVSKNELNISENELMERFVRGDSSRNTEGSGLGLAIAKNFMQLMNGRFVVEIDGDLFKAHVYLDECPQIELPETDIAEANIKDEEE